MDAVKHVSSQKHFLHKRNDDFDLGFGRDVADLQVDDVLALNVQLAKCDLPSFAFGLLELVSGLLLFLHYSFNNNVVELSREPVESRFGSDWEGVVDIQKAFGRVLVLLLKGDVGETVDDLQVVFDTSERDHGPFGFEADDRGLFDVAAALRSILLVFHK